MPCLPPSRLDQPDLVRTLISIAENQSNHGFSRERAIEIAKIARDRIRARWQTRCIAAHLLADELDTIGPEDLDELCWWFCKFGVCTPTAELVDADVLRQGYSTREIGPFAQEFRRRLQWRPSSPAGTDPLAELIRRAEQPHRLPLARYLISAEDVATQILSMCRCSKGSEQDGVGGATALARLPRYEAAIVEQLRLEGRVLWLGPRTPRRLGGLIEHPLGTAAIVIKPPGSTIELEIKRVGLGSERPVNVIVRRGERRVPGPHRFQGVCLGRLLNFEVHSSARLQNVMSTIGYGMGASPRFLVVNRIDRVPLPDGRQSVAVVDYLSNPRYWPAAELERLHGDIREAVSLFTGEGRGSRLPSLPGPIGAAAELFAVTKPSQGVLLGTTSYRLDQLTRLLSDDGPALYFGEVEDVSDAERRWLADTLLAEILANYSPPAEASANDYGGYLAVARGHNRPEVERAFLDVCEQLGRMFAALLALRAYSMGESFVARNVGLRAVWEAGAPRVRMVFMDHDSLHLPSARHRRPLLKVLKGIREDHLHAFGPNDSITDFSMLARIYGCDDALRGRGRARIDEAARVTYAHVQRRIRDDAELARTLAAPRYHDLDTLLAAYRDHRRNAGGWVSRVVLELERTGCSRETANALGVYAREADEFIAALADLTAPARS